MGVNFINIILKHVVGADIQGFQVLQIQLSNI